MTMTPGTYLRKRREAACMSREDLALRLETVPAVSARRRAEWLADIEDGIIPVSENLVRALLAVVPFPFDAIVLVRLMDIQSPPADDQGPIARGEPRLCEICACSECDPCEDRGMNCGWVAPTLCSACVDTPDGQKLLAAAIRERAA